MEGAGEIDRIGQAAQHRARSVPPREPSRDSRRGRAGPDSPRRRADRRRSARSRRTSCGRASARSPRRGGCARSERAGEQIGDVTEVADRGADDLLDLGRDGRRLIDDATDRHRGDAGPARDLAFLSVTRPVAARALRLGLAAIATASSVVVAVVVFGGSGRFKGPVSRGSARSARRAPPRSGRPGS